MAVEKTDLTIVNRNNKNYFSTVRELDPPIEDFDMIPGPPVIAIGGAPQMNPKVGNVVEIFRDGLGLLPRTNQWQRDDVDIAGATGETYTIVSQDQEKNISLKQTFSDGDVQGSNEITVPKPIMPWDGHNGGIWHIKNVTKTLSLTGGPFTAWSVSGFQLRPVSLVRPGDELVFTSSPASSRLFAGNPLAAWEFGEYTNTSKVTDMSYMLETAERFNSDISNWNVSNVTNMSYMFRIASAFNSDLDGWDVGNVADMSHMFEKSYAFNGNISGWNVVNVTNMTYMFSNASKFNSGIGNWNTSNVTNMIRMFTDAREFSQDIGNWNVSNLTSLSFLFDNARKFNSDIRNWNVSNVTEMTNTFSNADAFNIDVSNWDVTNVTNMRSMFVNANVFNIDISSWDVSNVTEMSYMFNNVKVFNQNLSSWCVSKIGSYPTKFRDLSAMPTNKSYDPKWGTCPP